MAKKTKKNDTTEVSFLDDETPTKTKRKYTRRNTTITRNARSTVALSFGSKIIVNVSTRYAQKLLNELMA